MNAPTPTRTGPSIKRGSSKQDYCTPRALVEAIEERFGPIWFDLAATSGNCVVGAGNPKGGNCYFGPDNQDPKLRDSLEQNWSAVKGNAYCNPPFANLAPWAAQSATVSHRRAWTLLLVPAAVDSNWYSEHVHGKAFVMPLSPRIAFDKDPYPKGILLAAFGFGVVGFEPWRWKP